MLTSSDPGRTVREKLRIPPSRSRYRYVRMRWRVLFGLIDACGKLLFAAAGACLQRRPLASLVEQPPQRILLVQLDHLGDAALTTTMLPALRKRWPQAEIDVLATPATCDLFALCPEINRVFVCRASRHRRDGQRAWLLSLVRWAARLRRLRYDVAFDVRGEFPHALLLWLAAIPRRVGWAAGGGGFLLTHSAKFVRGRSEVRSRYALLETVGLKTSGAVARPVLQTHPRTATAMQARLAREIPGSAPLLVAHIGAGTQAKQWPTPHWHELLNNLHRDHDVRVVLIGSAADIPLATQITSQLPPQAVLNWVGQLSIAELVETLRLADGFVGADSGPAHLAAIVDCPSVVLFSGTNEHRQWQPRGRSVTVVRNPVACSPCHRQKCPLADHPCMRGIGAERVTERIMMLLNSSQLSRAVAKAG